MKEFKLPKTLGACADRVHDVRRERLDLEKKVELLKAEESALREHIIATLPVSQATGVAGKRARVTVKPKEIPQVDDWSALHKYIKRTGAFDLLQKRLSDGAVLDRLEDGKKLPGVSIFHTKTLSINKL